MFTDNEAVNLLAYINFDAVTWHYHFDNNSTIPAVNMSRHYSE